MENTLVINHVIGIKLHLFGALISKIFTWVKVCIQGRHDPCKHPE